MSPWLIPDWPAPPHVRAFVTTREGGVSTGEYASMNLGYSSGDERERVTENRRLVRAALPSDPVYMRQLHGIVVADLDSLSTPEGVTADAARTTRKASVATVLTADCMPLLLTDAQGTRVAAVHAGWRGMAAGIIEAAVHSLDVDPSSLLAWMGPTIGPDAFEVGPEVREAFMVREPRAAEVFREHKPGKFMADLYGLARQRLSSAGVASIHGGGFCTRSEPERFFSYRREPKSGRMGAFIWMD